MKIANYIKLAEHKITLISYGDAIKGDWRLIVYEVNFISEHSLFIVRIGQGNDVIKEYKTDSYLDAIDFYNKY